ncbi:polycystic kidney disease 2-like 1 protein [Zootermopsis nevadensis]|uniref:Polycystin-2 n=1 Tax=Zootermopsis nevadensis TaxID=136037 RepID=A0A067QIP3_ZOONE|nr:polycystic kidney disease 2-like 1 protein [Zootermopsis nevadensis]XP_021939303.1 polycystic kidney disease 2-like 1 protein [Zootermopsis nevadensis]XP_021939304.1 polycystic kidney disease 2-like 1 protein [Zootermopsis nevadensis]KDR08541.1 Polycystin-2 [Zootermopsis nevadensis]
MGTVQEQEHSADDDIQYHDMEHDSELDISHNPSPVDQGNNPSDSVDRGHASKSSGKRQKGNLKGMKQRNTNKEGYLHLIFIIIVLIGTFGKTDKMTYWCKKLLDDLFVETNFQVGVEERNFKNISHISHFWKFAETVMIDSLYGNLQDDTHQTVGYMLEDYKLIGAPRLRQVKVRNDSCIINEAFKRLFSECYDVYSSANEDKGQFGPGIGTAWTYSTEEELHGSSYWGRFSTYGGGGYYEDLSLDRIETIEKLLTLKINQWVTRGTRAIFLDFIVYNANIDAILTLT